MARRRLPKILKTTAEKIRRKSRGALDKSAAYAVATTALQHAGVLRRGTNKLRRPRPRK